MEFAIALKYSLFKTELANFGFTPSLNKKLIINHITDFIYIALDGWQIIKGVGYWDRIWQTPRLFFRIDDSVMSRIQFYWGSTLYFHSAFTS